MAGDSVATPTEALESPANPPSQVPGVQRRAVGGIISLAARDAVIKAVAFVGWIVLARLLDPATFGLFAFANFALSVFALFGQLGMGAAVVRERGEIARRHLDALFTLQLVIVTGFALLMVAAAPFVAGAMSNSAVGWLLVALAGALVITSLRSVPAAMQERDLAYRAPVFADLVSQLTYWLIAISAAALGWGLWSVIASVLVSSALGTVVLLVRTRWRPALNFDWSNTWGQAKFGVMYGSQAMGHFLKYSMLPLLGGVAFGGTAAGYATWGHQVATLPMQLSNLVARVAYPAFSHMQEHREELNTLMSNALKWTGRVTFTLFAVIMALAPQITEFVYGGKWLPALTTLLLLCLSMALGTPVTVLLPALFALGRARTGMVISLGWTALTWIAGLILVFSGVRYDALAWAYLAASVVAAACILYALREFDLPRFLRSILQPLAISLGGGLLLWAAGGALVHGLLSLIVAATIGGLVILLANLWPDRKEILDTLNTRTAYMWR